MHADCSQSSHMNTFLALYSAKPQETGYRIRKTAGKAEALDRVSFKQITARDSDCRSFNVIRAQNFGLPACYKDVEIESKRASSSESLFFRLGWLEVWRYLIRVLLDSGWCE
ncbi:uncharacterized protein RAG0_04792 [Rhynchosporium agropyri]|uniref:Uncharacterized protein n=1 Tax=Rhynchosporium agropyri TaxID=914238 RepID=A0A1E1KE38_9HELO|nr:uncharacterized protein RAG0_04792 [Rhynchosporium agropyri]